MRVGVIGPSLPDCFADNISASLTNMGHNVIHLGSATPDTRSPLVRSAWPMLGRSITVSRLTHRPLLQRAHNASCDLIINTQPTVLPESVEKLHNAGCPVVLWFPDAVSNLDRQLMLASPYDAVFMKDRLVVQRLRATGGSLVHYLPEACNPAWHRPSPRYEVDPVVVVAGNLYPSRVLLLEQLHRARIPLVLYGNGFPRWLHNFSVQELPVHPPVWRHFKAKVFRRAAVVLNNLHPAELDSVNCRLFEAAGCGAAVVCEHRPVLPELFRPDDEVLTFVSVDELIDNLQHLLQNPDLGTTLGDRAAARALAEHTYEHRLTEMFEVLGLPSAGRPHRPT